MIRQTRCDTDLSCSRLSASFIAEVRIRFLVYLAHKRLVAAILRRHVCFYSNKEVTRVKPQICASGFPGLKVRKLGSRDSRVVSDLVTSVYRFVCLRLRLRDSVAIGLLRNSIGGGWVCCLIVRVILCAPALVSWRSIESSFY